MERTLTPEFEIELKHLLEVINLNYNYDFRQYSPKSVKRTVVTAMNRMGCPTLLQLEEKVLQDAQSFDSLIQSLTISVSEMFRDPTYFLALRERVIPVLKTYPSVKVWIAGCSTGEEAYSLAILFQEEGLLERTTFHGTDINARSLAKAQGGVFRLDEIQNASRNYQETGGKQALTDYYVVSGRDAQFNSDLKRHLTFSDHSLATDSSFAEVQLISCRNVLIYFNRELQDRAFGLFSESLCRKGFLGLGAKETVQFSTHGKTFDPFVKEDRIFQKK